MQALLLVFPRVPMLLIIAGLLTLAWAKPAEPTISSERLYAKLCDLQQDTSTWELRADKYLQPTYVFMDNPQTKYRIDATDSRALSALSRKAYERHIPVMVNQCNGQGAWSTVIMWMIGLWPLGLLAGAACACMPAVRAASLQSKVLELIEQKSIDRVVLTTGPALMQCSILEPRSVVIRIPQDYHPAIVEAAKSAIIPVSANMKLCAD